MIKKGNNAYWLFAIIFFVTIIVTLLTVTRPVYATNTELLSDSEPERVYSFAISLENIADFRIFFHENITRRDGGCLDSDKYKVKTELFDKDDNCLSEKTIEGLETPIDTAKLKLKSDSRNVILSPGTQYKFKITVIKKDENNELESYSFACTTKKANLDACINTKSTGNTYGVITVDFSKNQDVYDVLKEEAAADESNKGRFRNLLSFKLKEKAELAEPVSAVIPDDTNFAEPFDIEFSNLKSGTEYVFYIANSQGEEYCTPLEFKTAKAEIIPTVNTGIDKAIFDASIEEYKESDINNLRYCLFYRKSGGGAWTRCLEPGSDGHVGLKNGVPTVKNTIENLSPATEYDYILMVFRSSDEIINAEDLQEDIESLKSKYENNEYVYIAKKGFKTKSIAAYKLDPSISVPGDLPVTFNYDVENDGETTNTIKLKLSTPNEYDAIKAVAQIAEMDKEGGFKEYSEEEKQNKIAETYLSSENDFEGEFVFENLRENTAYYLKGIDVYINELNSDTEYKTYVHPENLVKSDNNYTIKFDRPEDSLMIFSGTKKPLGYFEVTGLKDLQKADSIDRGYDSLQYDDNSNEYIVAFGKTGDIYDIKLTDPYGSDIETVYSAFNFQIENPRIARIVSDGDDKHIELLGTGETKLTITPKNTEKFRRCEAKEIILKVKRIPSIPENIDIYALTGVKKTLSDIDLQSYGIGSEWGWANPDITLSTNHSDSVTEEGDARVYEINITNAAREIYYPLIATQKVKLREFKDIDISFINEYETNDQSGLIKGSALISADSKTAVVPLSTTTPAKKNGALVRVGFEYYGQGTNDELYTFYEWESLPDDVIKDNLSPCKRVNLPEAAVNQFSLYSTHNEGVKLKLSKVYTGHYNGGVFVKDVDLISEKLINEENLKNCAISLFAVNKPIVNKVEIQKVDKQDDSKTTVVLTENVLTFNVENVDGEVVYLKPVFYDINNNIIPAANVDYSFSSSNPEIASIENAADEYGTHRVDVQKKTGSSTLTLKVNDAIIDRSYEVGVRIIDFRPNVITNAATVNIAYDFDCIEGRELAKKTDTPIEINPGYGTKINRIMFSDTNSKDSNGQYSQSLDVDYFCGDKDNQYFVLPKNSLKTKKTYYMIVEVSNMNLEDSGESAIYSFPVMIMPKNNKIKASIKTEDYFNYFFTEEKGKMALTLTGTPYLDAYNNAFGATSNNNDQSELIWVDKANSAGDKGFTLSIDSLYDGMKDVKINEKNESYTFNVSFTANKLEVENKKLKDNRITSGILNLYLKGYKEPVTMSVKLPVTYQKPKLKVYSETIVPAVGKKDGRFVIIDENKNVYGYNGKIGDINKSITYSDFSSENNSFDVTYDSRIENIVFTKNEKDIDWTSTETYQKFTYNGTKNSDSTKITINDSNFREKLEVTLNVKNQTPYVKFVKGDDRITFNTEFESEYYSQLDTNLSDDYMKGIIGEITEDRYNITANDKTKNLLKYMKLDMCKKEISGQVNSYYIKCSIERLADKENTISPGKYTFSITPKTTMENSSSLNPLKFVITITNKAPKVVYQKKGAVDNLAVEMDSFGNMLNDSKSTSKAISTASKYTYVLIPMLVNYPSGSEIEDIMLSGDYMNENDLEGTNLFRKKKFYDLSSSKYAFMYLCPKEHTGLKAGDVYKVLATARIKIGSNSSNIAYEKENHELDVNIVQGNPKVSVVKGNDGKTLYKGLAGTKTPIELNIPSVYKISDAYGKLDINKDGIIDVEVKAELKEDGSLDYLYGVLCEDNVNLKLTGNKKVSVPVTVKFAGRDGITKDSAVKVSFVIVP